MKDNFKSIVIEGKAYYCGDILVENGLYIGVVHWCGKRQGFAIASWDWLDGIIICHCYHCNGDFELSDLDFNKVNVVGNIFTDSFYLSKTKDELLNDLKNIDYLIEGNRNKKQVKLLKSKKDLIKELIK